MIDSVGLHSQEKIDRHQQQGFPRALAARGHLVLHAALVGWKGKSFAIAGASGAGKSTLAASLKLVGWEFFGDDSIVVSKQGELVKAAALWPMLRLRGDSIGNLGLNSIPSRTGSNGKAIMFEVGREFGAEIRLSAIFILSRASSADSIDCRVLSPGDACMKVIENSFFDDFEQSANVVKRFSKAAEVTSLVPVLQLQYRQDYALLPSIVKDFISLTDTLPQSSSAIKL